MGGISTSVGVKDNLSSVFKTMTQSVNVCLSSFANLQAATGQGVNTAAIRVAQVALNDVNIAAANVSNELLEASGGQKQFNDNVVKGNSSMDGLLGKTKTLVGIYASIQGLKSAVGLSDTITQTTARLDLMNDQQQTTAELQNMIFDSAQRSRGVYQSTADAVSKLGMQAGAAFNSSAEIVAFAEQLNKSFVIAGTSAQGVDSVMLQLTQAMAAGKLQGEELNAVLDNAQPIVAGIQKYMEEVMGVDASNIKKLASEGALTADIIKNAIFYMADETNKKLESMPFTWTQVWNGMQNQALKIFTPILTKINEVANNEKFQNMANNMVSSLVVISTVAAQSFDVMGAVASFAYDNWYWLGPIIYGVATAMAFYTGAVVAHNIALGIKNTLTAISALRDSVYAAKIMLATGATFRYTASQVGLNAALLACPLTWIILIIIAAIAAIYIIIGAINHFANTSISATGVIAGAFAVLAAHIVNKFIVPTWNILVAIANFFANIFVDPVAAVKVLFFDLAQTVIGYILNMAKAIEAVINKIPGVKVDITGGLDKFYNQIEDASQKVKDASGWQSTVEKMEYIDYTNAAKAGYKFGEGIENKVSKFFAGDEAANPYGDTSGYLGDIANSAASGADNTEKIADSMEITEEDLKYIRDIAEREIIDRTVFQSLRVDMGGVTNTVNNMADLDGIGDYLGDLIATTAASSMEGVSHL